VEFVDSIPEEMPDSKKKDDVGLEIGMLKFKNEVTQLELKNVKITDLEGLRNLMFDILEEFE